MKSGLIRKIISCVICSAFLVSLATGCGSPKQGDVSKETTAAASSGQGKTEAEVPQVEIPKGNVVVWTWETIENESKIIADFNKDYPDITIEFVNVQGPDMEKKLLSALASGGDVPDVAWLEETQRGYQLSLDIWEDLSKDPYNIDRGNILDYMLPLSVNEKDELIGLEVSPSICGIAYRKDFAKKYFGTDDRTELENILTDWNAVAQKAAEVKSKSAGKDFLFASIQDVLAIINGQNSVPYAEGNKLNIKASLGPVLEQLITLKRQELLIHWKHGSLHGMHHLLKART